MSWHAVLLTAEQAAIWSTVAGLIALLFAWRPVRRALNLLDADTPGGLGTVTAAIRDTEPPPDTPRKPHGRPVI